jgi:L-ascorbate metabolism protein UlaG (beta-lactamase superfamily)
MLAVIFKCIKIHGRNCLNRKLLKRLVLDFVMLTLIIAEFGYPVLGNTAHELIGFALLALYVQHLRWNGRWFLLPLKRHADALRLSMFIINYLLTVSLVLMVLGGLANSHLLLNLIGRENGPLPRLLHTTAAYWFLIFLALHLGLHWKTIMAQLVNRGGSPALSPWKTLCRRLFVAAIVLSGILSFLALDVAGRLLAWYSFDFWDPASSALLFFARYLALVGLFATLAFYLQLVLKNPGRNMPDRANHLHASPERGGAQAFLSMPVTNSSLASSMTPPFLASRQINGRYCNDTPRPRIGLLKHLNLYWTVFFNKPAHTTPDRDIPLRHLTRGDLLAAPDNQVFRLGHSTLLLKMHGKFWLTDPVFSQRASPLRFLGPRRFHAAPITLEALPEIEAVILSHNHYDHLDRASVLALAPKTGRFIAPLGVGRWLQSWGIPARQVVELDWWQSTERAGIRFVATPAQHFSGRGLTDSNRTLWASWCMLSPQFRLFFSGDSGYFDGFSTIGKQYGPFDMTFMETGAYDHQWPHVHMQPQQTLQAHLDLGGRHLFPIHNSTFDLALHAWNDPLEQIAQLAASRNVPLVTPCMGQGVGLGAAAAPKPRWREQASGN